MIAFDAGNSRFNYRVAGVCLRDRHVLLHRGADEDFWALPGGRPEVLEPSGAALAREMREEIGLRVEVGRLLWVVELFFGHAGVRFHELGFYYEMALPEGADQLDPEREFRGLEEGAPLVFRWFPVDRLGEVRLYPTFLRASLAALPAVPTHIVHTDPGD